MSRPRPDEAYATLLGVLTASPFRRDPAAVTPEQTLEDLGLDSLDRAELALAIEAAVGRRVHDADVLPWCRVGQLAERIGVSLRP
jgi:acyl carrier protein